MKIGIAGSDKEIQSCFPVMRELRTHLVAEEFLGRVRTQERSGYRLAFVQTEAGVVAVAGFRLGENLAWGRFLYVDDLVTASEFRSKGFGAKLLAWLKERAVKEGCSQFHLDSGKEKVHAHRFYEREGLAKSGFHFYVKIASDL